MNNLLIKKYIVVALMITGLGLSAISNAAVNRDQTRVETMSVTVSDLDLSQEEGVITLYKRLKSSANRVCGTRDVHVTGSRVESMKIKKQFKRCYAKALNGAVESIDNEKLSDIHSKNS